MATKLRHFESAQQQYKKTVGLSKFIISVLIISMIASLSFMGYLLYQQSKTVMIMDSRGIIYNANSGVREDIRQYEYEDQVRMFYTFWYSFDESNYDEHIERALHLIGERGKDLLNEYNDAQVKSTLAQKNLRYEVKITKVVINPNTVPVSGHIEGLQTCLRATGIKSRTICANFTLYDVTPSKENLHGVKIDQWNIYDSKEINNPQDSISTVNGQSTTGL